LEKQGWQYTKQFITTHKAEYKYIEMENDYKIIAKDSWFDVVCYIPKTDPVNADQEDFETNYKANGDSTLTKPLRASPFASKVVDGASLFSRIHGEEFSVSSGTTICDFSVPYTKVKFDAIEILGSNLGDSVSLKILDNAQGTFTTIPLYKLNQFGFEVRLPEGFYKRESKYDSDLFATMIIRIEYTTIVDKFVYINYILHELK